MTKFKIGQQVSVVSGKSTEMKLFITQITEIACSAGKQTFYDGRIWQKVEGKNVCTLNRSIQFHEIELEK